MSRPTASDDTPPPTGLQRPEIFWRTHYNWFKDQGYQLRPRFAPDWVPSWKGTNKDEDDCEDGLMLINPQINDAIHTPTGSKVALKRVYEKYNPHEEAITRFLSSDHLSKDPRNHSVPLLDILHPPPEEGEDKYCILVLPWLRRFNTPIFDTFGEAVQCIRQLFEGVHFLHQNHIAHRDLAYNNFMMESSSMFPEGFHPESVLRKPDLSGKAKFFTRTQRPPKYYIIDFGLSRQYDADNVSPQEPIIVGADRSAPEFQNSLQPQNPYLTDIYYAGNLVRREFLEGHPILTGMKGYHGFEFLKPLIDDMVQADPTKRPSMEEVVKRFEDIVNGLSAWKLRSRTSFRRSNIFRDTAHMFGHWKRTIVYLTQKTPAIPRCDT